MSTILLIAIIFLATIVLLHFMFSMRQNKKSAQVPSTELLKRLPATSHSDEIGCDIAIVDEHGFKIIESKEIDKIPAKSHKIEPSENTLNRIQHLASDLFKGVVSVPNKTVELVFKQDIQRGLTEGAYTLMRTKSGEALADAVDSTGQIVGKGRVIQGGKARQLAGGAFQLVSIAVAQSHLADIEHSLSTIKSLISKVIERQENEDKSKISGAFDYLQEISTHMKESRFPDELSLQKKNAIEGIIKESYAWRNKLNEDISSLTENIKKLKDLDTFGTKNTYEKLKELTEEIAPLLRRRKLLLDLASATNFVTTYLDPMKVEFSKIEPDSENWEELINNFKGTIMRQTEALLSKARCNSKEILELRKSKIESLASNHYRNGVEQQKNYISLQEKLETSVNNLIDSNGNVRVAISFNENGGIKEAAIL